MYYIPCSDQYLFVHTNHCIEHHLGAMNKPYDEYPLVYVNGDICILYHFSDQHLLMFITEMSTHCLIQWRSSFPITMQWSASGDVYHCNEHPLLNNGDISIYFFNSFTMQWSASRDVYHCNEHPLLYTIYIYKALCEWVSEWVSQCVPFCLSPGTNNSYTQERGDKHFSHIGGRGGQTFFTHRMWGGQTFLD